MITTRRLNLDPRPDPVYAARFFEAAGRIIVFWGRFENQLDWGLRWIIDHPESIPIRPKIKTGEPMPRAFSQRIELWADAFKKMPSLAKMRTEALVVRDHAKQLVKRRDAIAHAQWS